MGKQVLLSRKGGKTRLDISGDGDAVILIFEPLQSGFLQALYDKDGSVLQQRLVSATQSEIDEVIKSSLSGASVTNSTELREIRLNKKCPKCGAHGLDRAGLDPSSKDRISVMPIYVCASCGGRGYHLTDHYLRSMISERKELFSEEELRQQSLNEDAFMEEIKAYIIRIFASKKIECIK